MNLIRGVQVIFTTSMSSCNKDATFEVVTMITRDPFVEKLRKMNCSVCITLNASMVLEQLLID